MIEGTNSYIPFHERNCLVGYNLIESNSPGFMEIIPGLISPNYESCNSEFAYLNPGKPYSVFFIEGNTLSGDTCNLKINIELHQALFNSKKPVKIKLCSIPKELYLFEKSLHVYYKNENDPFSEPGNIDGNIKGGYGIFAIYRSTGKTFTLPWQTILQNSN
jgi:hypothetical protein